MKTQLLAIGALLIGFYFALENLVAARFGEWSLLIPLSFAVAFSLIYYVIDKTLLRSFDTFLEIKNGNIAVSICFAICIYCLTELATTGIVVASGSYVR